MRQNTSDLKKILEKIDSLEDSIRFLTEIIRKTDKQAYLGGKVEAYERMLIKEGKIQSDEERLIRFPSIERKK